MGSITFLPILLLTVTSFPSIRGYILGPGCDAYGRDIEEALNEFVTSSTATRSTLDLQTNQVEDWFGLLESLFPGLRYSTPYTMQQWQLDPNYDVDPETISLTESLQNIFDLLSDFSEEVYPATVLDNLDDIDVQDEDEDLPEDLRILDSITWFWCDVTRFVKVDPMNDASPFWVWVGPGGDGVYLQITTDAVICPPGVNTRLAKHPASTSPQASRPAYLIAILCPQILTQTPGRPKMWATLDGLELTNTRPTAGTQDSLLWIGMHIDVLRQRVLSVWIGRMVILITSLKYSDRMHISTSSTTFEQCKTLDHSTAMDNLDSLSLYITGAKIWWNLRDWDDPFQYRQYWDENGIFQRARI